MRQRGNLNPQNITSRTILLDIIKIKYKGDKWDAEYEKIIKDKILSFSVVLSKKWAASNRNLNKFTKKNADWLQIKFEVPPLITNKKISAIGRPRKSFSESSDRTKKSKVKHIVDSYTSPELVKAISTKLHKSGKRNVVNVLSEAMKTPKRASKIKKILSYSNKLKPVPYSPDQALAFFIDNKLTKEQYINIRKGAKKRNCNIYPSYEILKVEKKKCYPDNCNITETSCQIPLQDLLNHTAKRILQIPTIKSIEQNMTNLEIIYKWGCDGSSGQARYNQKFGEYTSASLTDSDLFMFSLVPLQLRCSINQKTVQIWQIWQIWQFVLLNNFRTTFRRCPGIA